MKLKEAAFNKELVKKAISIAKKWHKYQKTKDGLPYISHLKDVASKVSTPRQKALAWLHDTLEDTAITIKELQDAGYDSTFLKDLNLLTRRKTETYMQFVKRSKSSKDAHDVKKADIQDHLEKVDAIPNEKESKGLKKRWVKAMEEF